MRKVKFSFWFLSELIKLIVKLWIQILTPVLERHLYLTTLMRGITSVLKNGNSLSNPEVYHEFCRLLGRLKANYQLGELTSLGTHSIRYMSKIHYLREIR